MRLKFNGSWSAKKYFQSNREASASSDFDNLKYPGSYYFGYTPTHSSRPIGKSGVLEVFTPNENLLIVTQRYTTYDGQNIYCRGYGSNGWSAWKSY